jgi:hypothetical protein
MSGLSHLLLTTADRKLYESTLDFYQALGFKPHTRTDSQIYLKLTATVPAQDLTIKLKLVDDGTVDNSEKSAATIVIASDNLEVSRGLYMISMMSGDRETNLPHILAPHLLCYRMLQLLSKKDS